MRLVEHFERMLLKAVDEDLDRVFFKIEFGDVDVFAIETLVVRILVLS